MNGKRSTKRSIRSLFALGIAGMVTVSGLTALGLPASAHDGVDHGSEPGAESALDWSNYEKVLLTKNVGEPIDLAVLPDKSVLHTARNGEIRHTDPKTGTTRVVATIPVYQNSEDGLQSVGIDPDFAENQWVYLVYAPLSGTPTGAAPNMLPAGETESYWDQWKGVNRLSRFTWNGSSLDIASEQKILDVDPFQTIDQDGVGFLIKHAVVEGRKTRSKLKIGICGEQGGEPKSVAFCYKNGLNYVSCSPFRVPIARLSAAQAAIKAKAAKK